jgi:hypothetical protein
MVNGIPLRAEAMSDTTAATTTTTTTTTTVS